ncbi:hypothetical protein D3C85_1570930 [compost metagenome]
MRRACGRAHAEPDPKIDDRHALSADIAQAEKIIRPVRDLEGVLVVEDFPHHLDRHGEDLLAETESYELGFR